jgi:triosephosphate isomerase
MARDKKMIVGNWKMNLNIHEASLFLHKLSKTVKVHRDVEVVLAPSMLMMQSLSLQVNFRQFKLAAQNFYWRDHGSFTGEVSASQLRGIVQYALVGHSERRNIFHENDKDIRNKVAAAIRNEIKPILCIGETAWERSNGETHEVLHDQLIGGLSNITSEELDKVIIAYEPVWAIGAGHTARPDEVVSAAKSIRRQIEHLYGKKAAENLHILYGGSVTSDSASEYISLPGIDGLLMGGASLDGNEFTDIVKKAHKGNVSTKKG